MYDGGKKKKIGKQAKRSSSLVCFFLRHCGQSQLRNFCIEGHGKRPVAVEWEKALSCKMYCKTEP